MSETTPAQPDPTLALEQLETAWMEATYGGNDEVADLISQDITHHLKRYPDLQEHDQ
jgi:hypothetical protein